MEFLNTSVRHTVLSKFECPICFELMTGAMVTNCGHTFCGECGPKFKTGSCPTCRGTVTLMTPNYFVRELIADVSDTITAIQHLEERRNHQQLQHQHDVTRKTPDRSVEGPESGRDGEAKEWLQAMGFSDEVAAAALRRANNDGPMAVSIALKMQNLYNESDVTPPNHTSVSPGPSSGVLPLVPPMPSLRTEHMSVSPDVSPRPLDLMQEEGLTASQSQADALSQQIQRLQTAISVDDDDDSTRPASHRSDGSRLRVVPSSSPDSSQGSQENFEVHMSNIIQRLRRYGNERRALGQSRR